MLVVGTPLTVSERILVFSSRVFSTRELSDLSLRSAILAFWYSRKSDNCKISFWNIHNENWHTNCAVLWVRLCRTFTRLKFTWVSCICSLNPSIVIAHLQFSHSRPRQWRRHCRCNCESVSSSESNITTRSRILSSSIFILCRSRKLMPNSDDEECGSVSYWTSANVTQSDYILVTTAI